MSLEKSCSPAGQRLERRVANTLPSSEQYIVGDKEEGEKGGRGL